MKLKISIKKYWEENIALIIIALGFIELLSEGIHEILKWPMVICGILSLFACLMFHKKERKKIYIIIIAITLAAIEIVFSEGILATQYIWDIGICLPVAFCVYCAKNINLKKWIMLYSVATIFLIICFVTSPDSYQIFYNRSRNYISVFEIFLLFMASIIADKTNNKLPDWMIYTTVIVCIMAVGRGGIIASLLILVLHVLYKVHTEKYYTKKITKIVVLLIGIVSVVILFTIFQDYIIEKFFPRFGHTGIESRSSTRAVSKRLLMWSMYIDTCFHSLKMILLGANPYPITFRVNDILDFNLHNSYLMLHTFYGIIGIIVMLVYTIKFIRNFWNAKNGEIVIIFIGFLVRAFSDHCFPGCLSGIVMWIAIFYGSNYKKRHITEKKYLEWRNIR